MRKKAILITGASGEIGQALITNLSESSSLPLLTLDLHPVPQELMSLCVHIGGDILDHNLLARLVTPVMYKLIPPAISPATQTGGTLAAPAGALPAPASRAEQ